MRRFSLKMILIVVASLAAITAIIWSVMLVSRTPRQKAIAMSQSIATGVTQASADTPYFCIGSPDARFFYTLRSVDDSCAVQSEYGPGWKNQFWSSSSEVSTMSFMLVGSANQRVAIAVTMTMGEDRVTESRYLTLDSEGYRSTRVTATASKREVAIW